MSYEGYTEYKCKCGNKDVADVYEQQPVKCSKCGDRYHKIRSVDCTNDVYKGPWRKVEWAESLVGMYVQRRGQHE